MQLIISNEVRNDITEIYNYIARDSLKYANETVDNIYLLISKLEMSPYLGRYVPEFQDKRYRELIYKSYRIVYSVFEDTKIVYIRFVVHGKRNFKSFYYSYMKNNEILSI